MVLTEGSETSADLILTPGKYPKEHVQDCKILFVLINRIYSQALLFMSVNWSGFVFVALSE
jgi:hypothetical protein